MGASLKEGGYHCRKQEVPTDEITLRDEILALKRQVMILKRTNEQYSVRLRKYEDESRRKDRQLEQLMNPRKNTDVTKLLSSKGAAILMNLKDQNNALIQMLLNKDLTIRRLVAEVKMSKLYASTKRNECYKAEISRLRNLLIKSEETLRENAQVQEEQRRSICAGGDSILEFSSSSDGSSPRDLDELRCTIMRLETHIKYSNDLLARKNQEISLLSDELSFLRKYSRYKASKTGGCDFTYHKLSAKTFTRSWPDPLNSKQLSSRDLLDLFENHSNPQYDNLSRSAPAGFTAFESDSALEHRLTATINGNTKETHEEASLLTRTNCKRPEVSAAAQQLKSLSNDLTANEVLKDKMLSNEKKTFHTKNKWKEAFMKFKELEKLKSGLDTVSNRKQFSKNEISKALNFETEELESDKDFSSEKVFMKGATLSVDGEKSLKTSDKLKSEESPEVIALASSSSSDGNDNRETDIFPGSCQSFETYSQKSNNSGRCSTAELEKRHSDKDDAHLAFHGTPPQTNKKKSLREVYFQSLDSSFDSENSYTMNHEVQQVEVEVQINSVSLINYNEESENGISGSSRASGSDEDAVRNRTCDPEFNDDDDVIVR